MDVADDNEDTDENTCDEDGPPLPTDKTFISPDEYYENRLGDLSPFTPPTQLTQQVEDPRRLGRHLSNISDDDATDVICILHPCSPAAFDGIRANLLTGPQHILQNDDLKGLSEDDILFGPQYNVPRDIALRMSSQVKDPQDGFRFGRSSAQCDVLLTSHENDNLVSKVHFKIFVNSQGSLMLQDLSTNGTLVDDQHIKVRDRRGKKSSKPATMALTNGAIISVISGRDREEIKLMVRRPARGDNEDAYERNLRAYIAARGELAQFASMRESSYGNHWNGGSLYNFTGLLGKGAFATVYRIQTKNEGNIFAAKELDKRRFIKNGVLDIRFDSELNIMKTLKHPNIVNYVDCQTYDHWIYILMEYVPYGELSQELRKLGKIPESDVQQITRQILHALDYLHRRNITHRDIKPDNILIASRSPLIVKLSDFGLSKCVTTDQETFLKTFCGTLLYCAPEVYPDYAIYAQNSAPKRRRLGEPVPRPTPSPYDQSVDMWSFGAVIFHMLCGKPPITGRGDDRGAQMLSNIMTKDVDFEPLRQAGVSEAAIDLIGRLLNRNPALRPKESECLQHSWLRDIPDNCAYEAVEEPILAGRELHIVDEVDEDVLDEELINNLNQLTQPPSSGQSPDRPVKRARTFVGITQVAEDSAYPTMPEPGESLLPLAPTPPAQRLFGEISQSVLRSSGLFGKALPPTTTADVHDIQNRVEQISVNDFGRQDSKGSEASADFSDQLKHFPQVPGPHMNLASAASLMGAEQQIGQLNMGSPEADNSDPATPETTNPVTPQTRELSPSSSISQHVDMGTGEPLHAIEEPVFTRQIDLGLIADPVNFEAELEARNASRAGKLRGKADTFHGNDYTRSRPPSIELAVTIDAKTGHVVGNPADTDRFIRAARHSDGEVDATAFIKPPRRFGKLTSLPGSIANVTINLESRLMLWGRGIDCTTRYPDTRDTRIPKYAMKIHFWAPRMDQHVEQGGDWTEIPGVRTIIATSASGCIHVNGVELHKESPGGDAALFGKLYTGDIITIYESPNGKEFLKFKIEITFGDSARSRPEKEAGFIVQEERHHYQRMKERESMRMSKTNIGQEAA
ncbi:Protein kinase protein rad53 [Elasticomyces elasticus]|uniref:non-specific serine/threonine protein kinase n=1 Tax=Exophiala sideris TaxID=1016849 RepID=A0ABR0IUD6_9EURO|nr:Protein kinase protein rad53 [Elasticomyces elasticus]KAK5020940.1 Protein kinase protein rad53 [Exophiala sideris]KAK5025450.1 Protein kinase protein rad53 [Exophiala sideris]KAK5048435.1 Protein kinase protein rad53 [Exophiala sideris]KAK5176974.1 Protein kinase protein rad53 [Eurotiomycetes sp. CCFEE 6388]